MTITTLTNEQLAEILTRTKPIERQACKVLTQTEFDGLLARLGAAENVCLLMEQWNRWELGDKPVPGSTKVALAAWRLAADKEVKGG